MPKRTTRKKPVQRRRFSEALVADLAKAILSTPEGLAARARADVALMLIRLMHSRRMTTRQLADRADTHEQTVLGILSGTVDPTLDDIGCLLFSLDANAEFCASPLHPPLSPTPNEGGAK